MANSQVTSNTPSTPATEPADAPDYRLTIDNNSDFSSPFFNSACGNVTDTIKYYINGELSSTDVSSYPGGNPNDYDMAIFNLPTGRSANYQFLGKLDEIRISDTIRSY